MKYLLRRDHDSFKILVHGNVSLSYGRGNVLLKKKIVLKLCAYVEILQIRMSRCRGENTLESGWMIESTPQRNSTAWEWIHRTIE